MRPADRRRLAEDLRVAHVVSQRRVCVALKFPRSTLRYEPMLLSRDAPFRRRFEEIAAVRVRYGYKRIHTLLRREGLGRE